MKNKIRELLFKALQTTFTSPESFSKWILKLRQQENLLNKTSIESPDEYNYSKEFIEELFWQIVCLKYVQLLEIPAANQNLDYIENLIKKYDGLESIKTLLPLDIDTQELKYCAWDTLKEIDTIVNESDTFVERNNDIDNFFYHLRHWSGHGVRGQLSRFASRLSSDLKQQ